MDYGEPSKLVFSLQDPKPVLCMKGDVQVTVEPKGRNRHWDYEVTGSFVQRSCAIKNRAGHVAAQVQTPQPGHYDNEVCKILGGVELQLWSNG